MSFADGMKKRRKDLRLTQVELSRICGVPQSTISAVEIGARVPTEETMMMIARGLGCTVGDLLGEMEIKKEPAIQDDRLKTDIILRIRSLSDPALSRVSDFLDGLKAGQETASGEAAAPDPSSPRQE